MTTNSKQLPDIFFGVRERAQAHLASLSMGQQQQQQQGGSNTQGGSSQQGPPGGGGGGTSNLPHLTWPQAPQSNNYAPSYQVGVARLILGWCIQLSDLNWLAKLQRAPVSGRKEALLTCNACMLRSSFGKRETWSRADFLADLDRHVICMSRGHHLRRRPMSRAPVLCLPGLASAFSVCFTHSTCPSGLIE